MTILDPSIVFAAWWATALEDAQFSENDIACEEQREPTDIYGEPAAEYLSRYQFAIIAMCVHSEPLMAQLNENEYPARQGDRSISEVFGSDLYLTAVGHGAGFWDGDWGPIGDDLTELTKRYITGGNLAEHKDGGYFFI